MKTYAVIYKTGGSENYQWNRVLERYQSIEDAKTVSANLERIGYETLLHDASLLDVIGLPDSAADVKRRSVAN